MFVTFDPDHIRKAAAFVEALADLEERFGYQLAVGVGPATALGIKTTDEPSDGAPLPLVAVRGVGRRLQLGVRSPEHAPECDLPHEMEA